MKTFSDTLLSKFDNAIRQIGPMSMMIDKVVSRVAPTVEVKACGGSPCGEIQINCLCSNGFAFLSEKYAADGQCGGPYTYFCQISGCDYFYC